ncbi:Na+/melibiose symporter-like transporter [Frondihabitans sp. PhB188]|uniref:MFS transporter n=1 Tax=Frondihabitans sp. PhB188 TaxID=2485200 RepID=UPI000F46F5CA|nr:MFS transporter [Frondihabitans sp. PhB188]ROQ39735.1 Na+/melibiose symporter-like transporter [Frondihabitans sp. PhB188]
MSTPEATKIPDPLTQAVSTVAVSKLYLWGLGLAQFGIFVALLSPVYVSMQLKAQELAPTEAAATAMIASVLPIGALGALFANPLAGALSDRTRTRWGRRRPWLLGGSIVFIVGLAVVAYAQGTGQLIVGWLICQVAANATYSTLTASFADNVPQFQRGRASSIISLAQNGAVLFGTYLAVFFAFNLPVLFIAPGFLALALVIVYAFVARDELPTAPIKKFTFLNIISSFWTNPIKNPDFAFAWWSRFLIIFATFMFTTYRLFYMQHQIGLGKQQAVEAVAFGVLLYTIALIASTAVSGWLSDKLGRRKIFVGGSTALFAVGLIILAHTSTLGAFYLAEVIMGFAYGIYASIDTALVVDVLPNADKPGKDLGVINIANALPQSLAPAFAGLLLGIGSAAGQNYTLMLWGAGIIGIVGALAVIPIKRVR